VDARARRYLFDNPSLAFQMGLSLQHPTEQLYMGVGLDLFPGFDLGAGLHFAHVETSPYASGEFVPFDRGPATTREWKSALAATVTLDASTFVSAFGKLLGL
jgi:hypothetical protein